MHWLQKLLLLVMRLTAGAVLSCVMVWVMSVIVLLQILFCTDATGVRSSLDGDVVHSSKKARSDVGKEVDKTEK